MIGQRYRPDVVGLQEVLRGQLEELVSGLPDFDWIGVGRDDGWAKGEYSPIFYRRERLELLETNETASGKAMFVQIAAEMQHPEPEVVIGGGLDIMENLREKGIITGTNKA